MIDSAKNARMTSNDPLVYRLEQSYTEKRSFFRNQIKTAVSIARAGETEIHSGITHNLSPEGMLLETNQSFEPKTELQVCIDSNHERFQALNARARVIRCESYFNQSVFLVALQFIEIF